MNGPIDPLTYKRKLPWNPMDMGVILFDIQTMKIVESIPFMSTNVYCNGDKRYVQYLIDDNEWNFPVALTRNRHPNGEYPYIWEPLSKWPEYVPKELLVMAMLLKG